MNVSVMRAFCIAGKDVESYYGKPPLITWGLLFPAVLILAVYLKDPGGYITIAPGIVAMTLLFGNTSMAAIVVTFEKRAGTFQRLLLAPLSIRTILAGKGTAAGLYGVITAIVLVLGLVFIGLPVDSPLLLLVGLCMGAGVFSAMGLIASILVKEVFEAMTLMNFFRFPLLFISGVFMPLEHLPGWMMPVALASPLTHVVELLKWAIAGEGYFSTPAIPLVTTGVFLVGSWIAAEKVFAKRMYA